MLSKATSQAWQSGSHLHNPQGPIQGPTHALACRCTLLAQQALCWIMCLRAFVGWLVAVGRLSLWRACCKQLSSRVPVVGRKVEPRVKSALYSLQL
jgi:hypothetical protein